MNNNRGKIKRLDVYISLCSPNYLEAFKKCLRLTSYNLKVSADTPLQI